MKILISGASGSFGRHLIKVLDEYDTISLRHGHIAAPELSKLSACDVFIHCGALLDGSFSALFDANVLLTKSILDHLSVFNPHAHVIYFSSMSLLQDRYKIKPDSYLDFKEMSDYALSKYIAETLCSRYNALPLTIVRFSTLFFKDPKRDGLSKLIRDAVRTNTITLYNDGSATRDFLPVNVAALYVKTLAGNKRYYGRTLNVASCRETTFKEIARYLHTQIPNLKIENRTLELNQRVPSNFDCADMRPLKVDFDLFSEIAQYIRELQLSSLRTSQE